jgi:uncharacterized membrane protein YfcA
MAYEKLSVDIGNIRKRGNRAYSAMLWSIALIVIGALFFLSLFSLLLQGIIAIFILLLILNVFKQHKTYSDAKKEIQEIRNRMMDIVKSETASH